MHSTLAPIHVGTYTHGRGNCQYSRPLCELSERVRDIFVVKYLLDCICQWSEASQLSNEKVGLNFYRRKTK